MKKFLSLPVLLAAGLLAGSLSAVAKKETTAAVWNEDFAKARAESVKTGKPLLVLFTGSDWCPPCMVMEKETFSRPEFAEFAADKLVLFVADQPMGKQLPPGQMRQNEMLAEKLQIEGNPTLILFSPEGKELERHVGYLPGGPEGLEEWVKSAR